MANMDIAETRGRASFGAGHISRVLVETFDAVGGAGDTGEGLCPFASGSSEFPSRRLKNERSADRPSSIQTSLVRHQWRKPRGYQALD